MLYQPKDMANPWSDLELVRLGCHGESKRLNVDGELCGILVDVGLGIDGYQGLYRSCTIECPEDGSQHTVWVYHKDVQRKFEEKKPFLGDHVALRRIEDVGRWARYGLSINAPPAAQLAGRES